MSSHRVINYQLRPSKNIERKMICEALQRMAHFGNLPIYRYIGFGSRYFADFTLLHKILGIHQMISIEKDSSNKDWFEFNRPYKCIQPIYRHSNLVLPTLSWNIPTILWLDYDGKLTAPVFADILTFFTKAIAGSIFLITVNAEAGNNYLSHEHRLKELIEDVGEARVPHNLKNTDLSNKERPKTYRTIINNEIDEKIELRNSVLEESQKLTYRQLFNFTYNDDAQMLTLGGIIYNQDQVSILEKCSFHDFEYVKTNEEIYKIEVPNLTFREIHYLNQNLPLQDEGLNTFRRCIPEKEINQYAKIYRYFPAFTEAEV